MHPPSVSHLLACTATLLVPLTTSLVLPQSLPDQTPFSDSHPRATNPIDSLCPFSSDFSPPSTHKIPTRYESTVLARRLLALSKTGVLSTVFPSSSSSDNNNNDNYDDSSISSFSHFPSTVSSLPIGLPDYIADCEDFGDPTILALDIATTFRNAAPETPDTEIRNISLSIDWWNQYRELRLHQLLSQSQSPSSHNTALPAPDLGLYSPSSLPRLTLLGHLEPISHHDRITHRIPACFLDAHPDASWWLPENPASVHQGRWLRLRVREAYWVGGFGDRAFIGWLRPDEWRAVADDEWRAVRLVGEDD